MVSVHSSPNDQMLWALDSRWNVHVRVGITEEMPVGTDWEHVPGRDGWARRAAPHGQAGRCGRGLLVCRAPQPVPPPQPWLRAQALLVSAALLGQGTGPCALSRPCLRDRRLERLSPAVPRGRLALACPDPLSVSLGFSRLCRPCRRGVLFCGCHLRPARSRALAPRPLRLTVQGRESAGPGEGPAQTDPARLQGCRPASWP